MYMMDTTPLLARAQGGFNNVAADFDVGLDVGARGRVGGGTNTRVATALLAAGGMLALLRFAGFRFNVGMSTR